MHTVPRCAAGSGENNRPFWGAHFQWPRSGKFLDSGAPETVVFLWIIPRRNGANVGFSGESCINIRIREKGYISNRLSSQISIERRKNKNIQEKEKIIVGGAPFCTKSPVAPPEAAKTTDLSGAPISSGRAAGNFWIRAPRKRWFSSGSSLAEMAQMLDFPVNHVLIFGSERKVIFPTDFPPKLV